MRPLLAALLLSGCAAQHPQTLESLRDSFVAEGASRGVALSTDVVAMTFVPTLQHAAGRCFPNTTPKRVEISRAFWEDTFWSDDTRRQIVYHELGHCMLGVLDHTPNLSERPVSLMEHEPMARSDYYGHEAKWLDLLFKGAR